MLVSKAEIFAVRLPLHQPFVVSYGRFDDMPSILLKLTAADGSVGWGEAVPDPHVTGETFEGAYAILEHTLLPMIRDISIFSIEALHVRMNQCLSSNPSAKAAVDIAFHDLMGNAVGEPLYKLLGGMTHSELAQPYVISIKHPDAVADEAREAIARGYKEIKLKVGANDGLDAARIQSLRAAIPATTPIRVDANQGWNRVQTLNIIDETQNCGVDWYEQPLPADDLEGMAEIKRSTRARIMLDEAIHSPQDLSRAIRLGSGDMVNIKLMKAGGINPAAHMTSLAEAAGLPCQIGSMVESAVGTAAGLHLATARKGIQSNELVGPEMISTDIATMEFDPGTMKLPAGNGLGINVREDVVERLTVRKSAIPLST